MRSLARISACSALLVAFALPAAAQGKHVFHPGRDLPGFEASDLSEYADLYLFEEFKALDGKELADAELAALRQRWTAERERVAKQIAVLESDPRERWIWLLGKKLARHSYFSKIAYTIERPEPGYVLILQRPAKEDPGYAARIAGFYMPFVKRMAANFDALVVQPAALVRRADQPVTAFAVLASKGDLDNFQRFVQDPTGYTDGTSYDYQLQLAVTFEDPFASGVSVVGQRSSLLYQLAKELQHAYLAIPGNRPGSIWMYEGLAFLLAAHKGNTPESLDMHSLRPDVPGWIVDLLKKAPDRELLLLPVDELAQLRSWNDYYKAVLARAKRAQVEPPDDDTGYAYYGQCELWTHYLLDGAQGAYRKPYLEFVQAAFRGKGDAEDLRRAFAGTDLRSLSRDFLRYVCSEAERAKPGVKVDRATIDTLFADPAAQGSAAADSAPAAAPAEPEPLVPDSFAPAQLAPDPSDAEAQFALALLQARDGDLAGATQALAALAGQGLQSPWPERLLREVQRLAELEKLRTGYLAALKASGARLSLKHKGKDLTATVVGIENGLVRLGENKLGLPSIPLASLEPYEIAKVAAKKEQQGDAQPWARFYAYLLAGDARWEKLLKDDSPAAVQLRADGKDYAQLGRTALAARELFELSKLALPRGQAEAGARLERVKSLLVSHSGCGLLTRRMDALRLLARSCLAEQGKEAGSSFWLHGKSQELEDGRLKLSYTFDDAREAEDWVKVPAYFQADRNAMQKIAYTDKDSRFEVAKGALRGVGSTGYRFVLPFIGPACVRYRFRYLEIDRAYATPQFCFALYETSPDSCYLNTPGGALHVQDNPHNDWRTQNSPSRPTFDWGKDWAIEFGCDGKDLYARFEGEEYLRLAAGKLDGGYVGFVVHSELPIVIADIELEGRVDPAALARLRESALAQELKKLGFP